jgi:hypothetical protein
MRRRRQESGTRIRDGAVVLPCWIVVEGLYEHQYFDHGNRRHYGDNVCVLAGDDPAKERSRARLRRAVALERLSRELAKPGAVDRVLAAVFHDREEI